MRILVFDIPYLCEKVHLGLDVFPNAGNEQPLDLRVDLRLDPQLLVPLLQVSSQIGYRRVSFHIFVPDISFIVSGRRN